jgi:hypothetical protein
MLKIRNEFNISLLKRIEEHVIIGNGKGTAAFLARVYNPIHILVRPMLKLLAVVLRPRWLPALVSSNESLTFLPLLT